MTGVEQEIKKIRDYIGSLTGVIQGVEERPEKTIPYQGKRYRRQALVGGLLLSQGGAAQLPDGTIVDRTQQASLAKHRGR